MPRRWPSATHLCAIFAILTIGLCASGAAHAVTAIGAPKRVDVDPAGTPIYGIGNFHGIRTDAGGFATAWEENTLSEAPHPIVYERIPFRIYNKAFTPVAGPQPANITGRTVPNLAALAPFGPNLAYLVYKGTRNNPGNPDHPKLRDALAQAIMLSTGAASGARQLLNSTGNWDTLTVFAASLRSRRVVAGWYENDAFEPAFGRSVLATPEYGQPQPIFNLNCCTFYPDTTGAQLTGLFRPGLASYLHRTPIDGEKNGLYVQAVGASGVGNAKLLTHNTRSPFIRPTSFRKYNEHTGQFQEFDRFALFTFEPLKSPANHYKLVGQVHSGDRYWEKVGAAKTLIADTASSKYLDVAPTLDGGFLLVRTILNGGVYTRSVRRLNASLVQAGPDYTFPASKADFFRVAAISSNRAVVLYRNVVSNRHQLWAQLVSY